MNKIIISVVLALITFFSPVYALSASADKQPVVIGVLAFRSKLDTQREWTLSPTI